MTKSETLQVRGARLFYRVRGKGPLLLILSGGHGDADTTDMLCENVTDRYTVVTYDRRGLSRSKIDADAGLPTIVTHGEDAHQLLATLATEPSLVFGSSIGALIGLYLVARHPEQVQVLVAHEPPAWELLPQSERNVAMRAMEDIVSTFHRQGANAAFQKFATLASSDHADREIGVAVSQPTPQIVANMNFFFSTDAPSVGNFRLDLPALKAASTRIVAAGGASGRETAPYHCATELAAKLDTAFAEFPGGHTGWLLRPKGFATKLLEILKDR
jgi:pimeloyl-ACP methyl ester carboxylesterase